MRLRQLSLALRAIAIVIAIFAGQARLRAQDEALASTIAHLSDLISRKNFAQALTEVDSALRSPQVAANSGWALSFGNQAVKEAFLGQHVGYFCIVTSFPRAPIVLQQSPNPLLNTEGAGDAWYVTAVNLENGSVLWSRAFPIEPDIAIDPRDDSLWVWDERAGTVRQIDSKGGVARQGTIPKTFAASDNIHCLLDGDTELWCRTHTVGTRYENESKYDLSTGELSKDARRPYAKSPGGLRTMNVNVGAGTAIFNCNPAASSTPAWSYRTPLTGLVVEPTWIGRDALLLAGGPDQAGVLVRLDGETGEVKWRAPLNAFAYLPSAQQLRDGDYCDGGWLPYGTIGGEVFAIDLEHRLHFFDAATGRETRSFFLPASPIAPPQFNANHQVTIATMDGMSRFVSLASDQASDIAKLHAIRIRSLIGLERIADIPAEMQRAAVQAQSAADWNLLADARESSGHSDEAVGLRIKAMSITGETTCRELASTHGLIARLRSGPVSAIPAVDGGLVLFGDENGVVWSVDPITAQVASKQTFNGPIGNWWLQGDRLLEGSQQNPIVVRDLGKASEISPDDPLILAGPDEPRDTAGVDPSWYTRGSPRRIGKAQRIDGRLVRPMAGGGVRELVNGTVVESAGSHADMLVWEWAKAGAHWYAIGAGGVYKLDQALRPSSVLIDLKPGARNRLRWAWRLASDGKTFCISVRDGLSSDLQIWSLDGKRLIRSSPVLDRSGSNAEGSRLLYVQQGYLLCSGEIAFLPEDATKPARRFSLRLEGEVGEDRRDVRRGDFGTPRVVGDRLIVAASSGGIYCFDLGKFINGR